MTDLKNMLLGLFASFAVATAIVLPASAQQPQKPNILVIMADDIGYWNISSYNRGQMGYRTPNAASAPAPPRTPARARQRRSPHYPDAVG